MRAPPSSTSFAPLTPWGTADAVFDALAGAWTLARTIEGQASMTGIAVFTPGGQGVLKYREEGRIRLADGKEFDGHREYLFERAPGGFVVHFAETPPRLFHAIGIVRDGDALAGSATHLCTPDTYDSSYRFLADGSFEIRHTVRGPRKDYLSATVFTRRAA
ncbi:DUF6314 family protein [Variovorax sp. E3]|uniref:DUF6314 family protein n=1 Tax=Variovorax sp. E3 TaxID=1914993 RepID=UPI0018DC9A6E|nr:DUF6314 family protein [Variovorax sp. E3]